MTRQRPRINPHRYYRADEVLKALQICRKTLKKHTATGELECIDNEGMTLYSGQSVLVWWYRRA